MLPSLIDTSLFIESSEGQYEKISDNVYLIRDKEGKKCELHRNDLIYSLKELYKYSHVFIDHLKEEHKKLLDSITEATRILHHSKVLKELVLKDIKTIFDDLSHPVPGTVGAFFVGCYNKDNFKGPLGCNPRCAASFITCDKEQLACEDHIFIFKDHQFVKLNKKDHKQPSEHVYIYIDDCEFEQFKSSQLNLLKRSHVKRVTLIYSNEDGTYKDIKYNVDITKIATVNDESNAWWIILIIFIIIVFVLLLGGMSYLYLR